MSAKLWKGLLAGPVALGAALFMATAEAQAQSEPQIVAQVTSISALSDVQPTDWAFQALQSLVERYGCIAGYPDGTYRGNRAMTRFEFAAGMNACLDRINELIAAGLADKVSREDLATVQRLQEEFQAELEALRGRVDALEAKTAELEAQQFSTTTKLRGEVVTGLFGATDNNVVTPYRLRLNFDASFFGNDRLRARLQARERANFAGTPVQVEAVGGSTGDNNIELAALTYTFQGFNTFRNFTFVIGMTGATAGDELFLYSVPFDATSAFIDTNGFTQDIGNIFDVGLAGEIAGADAFLPGGFNDNITRGTGSASTVGFSWQASDLLAITYGYVGFDAKSAGRGSGFFNGPYANQAELAFTPGESFLLSLQYANYQDGNAGTGLLRDLNLASGGLVPGDASGSGSADAFTVAVNWEITPRVVFSGWYSNLDGRVRANIPSGPLAGNFEAAIDDEQYIFGFAFPDLFLEGANGGIAAGQVSSNNGSPFIVDVYYSFPISDRITLTPGFYVVTNPTGPGSDSITVGGLRTTFSF